jgi:sortase A
MVFLRTLGKLLISVGFGILLFVVYTLWGTGFYTARQQQRLVEEFTAAPNMSGASATEDGSLASVPESYKPRPGEPVFEMRIPAIDLRKIVVEGVGVEELRLAPGHYPECRRDFRPPLCTPFDEIFPGEPGRVVVSGHRTTYGAPFWALNELRDGDEIKVGTKWGRYVYEVRRKEIVDPDSPFVIRQSEEAEMVLTTCNPRFSAEQRLIVYARMATPT